MIQVSLAKKSDESLPDHVKLGQDPDPNQKTRPAPLETVKAITNQRRRLSGRRLQRQRRKKSVLCVVVCCDLSLFN
ncbi:hypothetical protein L2E82_18425 [Cichorium intybus]|uniref:Uncharacterized protein n=1 Tax=Cichorium intybus TaxID=13427 RepID=A0ACB9FAM6_CICIN|nr:hypothetical protein L2E82_18425 [Cichorium intybus]